MVDRGRSRLVGRGSLVGRCRLRIVCGGRLVDGLGSIGGLALILDIHDIARVGISSVVGDNLGAAVGEEDAVRAVSGIAITGLVGVKLDVALVAVLGVDAVLVLVLGGSVLVLGLMVRGVGVSRVGSGHGHEGEEGNEGL